MKKNLLFVTLLSSLIITGCAITPSSSEPTLPSEDLPTTNPTSDPTSPSIDPSISSDPSTPSSEIEVIDVESVNLSMEKQELEIGETLQAVIEILPTNATDKSYEITSSNPSVASVNSTGLIEALSSGETEIKVVTTSGAKESKLTLTVNEPINYTERNVALNALHSTVYTNDHQVKENIGLSSLKDVGINEDRFKNEILYPLPSEGTFYNAEDIGITPENNNNSGTLSIFLQNIKNVEGNKIIKFKGITYPFTSTIDTVGIEDLYLVGEEGTEFLFSGWETYFRADVSKNVHISNITFDMKYSPTIGGTVKRIDSKDSYPVVVLDISDEFDLTQEIYKNWKGVICSYMEFVYDEATSSYIPDLNGNLFYNSPTSLDYNGVRSLSYNNANKELSIELNPNFPYRTCEYKNPEIGKHISFAYTMYENHGFHFKKCENVYLENVTVHTSGGMGLRLETGKNFYLNRFNYALKPGSSRLMTATADIVHSMAVEGDLKITNCTLENSHDDALNIKSFYTNITNVSAAAKEISVGQTQTECEISFDVGDEIEVYDPSTMTLIDKYVVKKLVKLGTSYTLTVDKRPTKAVVGYTLGNATKSVKLSLDNCLIANKRNRGILLQTRNSEIKNCTFQNVVMGGVQVLAVTDVFKEALVPQNIKIYNNKFIQVKGGAISVFAYGTSTSKCTPGTINGVEISNNYIYNNTGNAIWLHATGDVDVVNNLIHYDKKTTSSPLVTVEYAEHTIVKDNVLISANPLTFVSSSNSTYLTEENNIKFSE